MRQDAERSSRQPMRVRCGCGWETTGTEEELIRATLEHGRRVHNMAATRDEILAMVVPPDDTETHV